jgi:hypothetical protein
MADEGKLVKMEKDYTNEVDTALAASEKLVQVGYHLPHSRLRFLAREAWCCT